MKKVTAFLGTQRRKATYQAVQEFERNLKQYEEIDFEYVFLGDYHLEYCRGCKLCTVKGEEYCPLKDDRDLLVQKLDSSDAVIFATPNYCFQVSARMKNFMDRTSYFFHRPKYFGKAFTGIITQGIGGGGEILKYLESCGENYGFSVTKGCCLTTLEPMTERQQRAFPKGIKKASTRFYKQLARATPPPPSFFRLMLFRMSRTAIKGLDQNYRDYAYYKEHGWFESDHFYETSLGPTKRLAGRLFDFAGRQMAKRM